MVIATGNGAHAWWLFKEPYVFDDTEDRKDTAVLVSRWQTSCGCARRSAAGPSTGCRIGARVADSRNGEPQGPEQSEGGHSPHGDGPADTTFPISRSIWTLPRSPIRQQRRRPPASGPNGSRTSRWSSLGRAHPTGDDRRLDGQRSSVQEHLAAPASRPERPEPDRV